MGAKIFVDPIMLTIKLNRSNDCYPPTLRGNTLLVVCHLIFLNRLPPPSPKQKQQKTNNNKTQRQKNKTKKKKKKQSKITTTTPPPPQKKKEKKSTFKQASIYVMEDKSPAWFCDIDFLTGR